MRNEVTVTGVKHTRYTILAQLHPGSVLRSMPQPDPPSKNRDYSKDSIAATVVCYRMGQKPGEVELLAILYENGSRGKTFRFPTETGEQGLDETPEVLALACVSQEILGPGNLYSPEIGPIVLENVYPSDSNRKPGPRITEIISIPEWYEASALMDKMISRGIPSQRSSLIATINFLAGKEKDVALHYARKLDDWGAYV